MYDPLTDEARYRKYQRLYLKTKTEYDNLREMNQRLQTRIEDLEKQLQSNNPRTEKKKRTTKKSIQPEESPNDRTTSNID